MKALLFSVAIAAMVGGIAIASTSHADSMHVQLASNHDNGRGPDQGSSHHWQRGERMGNGDWSSAQPVDYRQHHLRHPPRGYEWRQSNGQYVLAAVATGLIASIVLSR